MKRVVWTMLGCLTLTACGNKEPAAEETLPEPAVEMAPAEPVAAPVAPAPAAPLATPEPAANTNPLPLPEWEVEVQSAPAPQQVSATAAPQLAAPTRTAAATPAADFDPPAAATPRTAAAPAKPAPKKSGATVVVAEVQTVSAVPDPGSVPYKECLTFLKYKVVAVESGSYDGQELLAAHWGMKDGKRTAAASYKVGQRQKLTIEPLDKHPDLSRVMQADDTGEYSLSPFFVVSAR